MGSPGLTVRVSTVPAAGARTIDSMETPPPRQLAALFGPGDRDLGELERLPPRVEVGPGKEALADELLRPREVRLRPFVGSLRGVELPVHVGQLLRRRVGGDLEHRVAGPDAVADVDEARP